MRSLENHALIARQNISTPSRYRRAKAMQQPQPGPKFGCPKTSPTNDWLCEWHCQLDSNYVLYDCWRGLDWGPRRDFSIGMVSLWYRFFNQGGLVADSIETLWFCKSGIANGQRPERRRQRRFPLKQCNRWPNTFFGGSSSENIRLRSSHALYWISSICVFIHSKFFFHYSTKPNPYKKFLACGP